MGSSEPSLPSETRSPSFSPPPPAIELTASSSFRAQPPAMAQADNGRAAQPQQQQQQQPTAATRTTHAGSASSGSGSFTRRLSKTFQESEMPVGFLAATADMTSSVIAAARPQSQPSRTRRSSSVTLNSADERAGGGTGTSTGTGTVVGAGTGAGSGRIRKASRVEDEAALETLDENGRASLSGNGALYKEAARASETETAGSNGGHNDSMAANKRLAGGGVAATGISGVSGANGANGADGADGAAGAQAQARADSALYMDYENGYHFPPKYSTKESLRNGALAFWHYVTTPMGFLVVLYGMNIVAWGGMLFLLLCNASPAMCHPTCNNIDSPRRKWIEWDSQILTALFCVTGFGLAPWRVRDLYFLLQFRLRGREMGLRRLAGVYRGWLRLPGSDKLPADLGPGSPIPDGTPASALAFPLSKLSDVPLTGVRAPPTVLWHVDTILWLNIANTLLQGVLSGIMWGLNRFDRPSWSTGLFVALGCLAGAFGGLGMFFEGKRVKSIEGVPLSAEDRARLESDRQRGIYHYNNLSGKKPKEKPADVEAARP